jgi:hypothetical protein
VHNQRQQEKEREEGIVQCSLTTLALFANPLENNQKGKEIPNSSEILGYLLPSEKNQKKFSAAADQPKICRPNKIN